MEKLERWIHGFLFLLGGIFLFIFMVLRLVDFFSKIFLYFMFIFFIILLLYSVILILIGILIMPVQIRLKKSIPLIIFFIGILIIILSITVIIIDSFTVVNISEIVSGIGLIYLGIRLFFPNEEIYRKEKKIFGIVLFVIGLIISIPYIVSLIMTIVLLSPEWILYEFPFSLLPFLIGIILIIFSFYSIKTTYSTQERKNKAVFSIIMGALIILTSYFAINSMINRSYYFNFYTPYFPVIFSFIGIALILYGFLLQQNTRKRSPDN